jgi:hypothetical protein
LFEEIESLIEFLIKLIEKESKLDLIWIKW